MSRERPDDWIAEAKDAARKGLNEQAANRTVALYVIKEGGVDVDIGTGVCLAYRGRFFIATAAHLMKRWREAEVGIIPKAAGNLETNPARAVNKFGFSPKIERVVPSPNPLDDLAVLVLAERPRGMGDEAFYAVDLLAPPPVQVGRQMLVCGYPRALVKTWSRGGKLVRFNVSPVFDAPRIVRAAQGSPVLKSRQYDLALHFLTDFPKIPGAVDNPKGMSGAGVWDVERAKRGDLGVWRPRLRLAGIQIAWHETARLVVATRVKRLWRILEGL